VDALAPYRHIWAVDFEFSAGPGERPIPLCVVARELRTGALVRKWLTDGAPPAPPYGTAPDSLFVAYYSSAELGCHLALDWPVPVRIFDLFAEFRCLTSGLPVPCGHSLLGALAYFGLDGLAATEKAEMRQLAMRGGPYTDAERAALLDYCQTDVNALARLLPAMLPRIDLPRALLRGRYMAAAARMEWTGVPLDTDALCKLRDQWDRIKGRLIAAVDTKYGVYVPVGGRTLNPESTFAAAVPSEAEAWSIGPRRLADAVNMVWSDERKANAEVNVARRAANPDAPDEVDHAGHLCELLRERDERQKPRRDPDVLRRAAEGVAVCPDANGSFSSPLRFSSECFAHYLARNGIPWPRLESGALALDDDTFREMARAYPAEIGPLRELRHTLGQLRLNELTVGSDGHNRVLLSVFGSRTGRNQPSNSKFIFGPSTWLRSLIRPEPGRAVAYVDWSAQELGIAAALSGDTAMQDAYRSGDPYLWLARRVGAVPADATKKTHATEREQFKVVSLGVLYSLSADGLARKLAVPPCRGRELLRLHQETFRRFWRWSDRAEMEGMLTGRLQTVFGWTVHIGTDANPRSLRNFPMQANGAEMMRLACCLATERGIAVCAPIHDALLVEGPTDDIEAVVAETQQAMREASELVLQGFPLRTDAKIVRHPERYADERGRRMWETVCQLLVEQDTPITGDTLPLSPAIPPSILISLLHTRDTSR
jgi:hypothetical protein